MGSVSVLLHMYPTNTTEYRLFGPRLRMRGNMGWPLERRLSQLWHHVLGARIACALPLQVEHVSKDGWGNPHPHLLRTGSGALTHMLRGKNTQNTKTLLNPSSWGPKMNINRESAGVRHKTFDQRRTVLVQVKQPKTPGARNHVSPSTPITHPNPSPFLYLAHRGGLSWSKSLHEAEHHKTPSTAQCLDRKTRVRQDGGGFRARRKT